MTEDDEKKFHEMVVKYEQTPFDEKIGELEGIIIFLIEKEFPHEIINYFMLKHISWDYVNNYQ